MRPFEPCTQRECYLREEGVNCHALAEMIVRTIAGEDVAVKSPIQKYERCVGCVQRILQGGKPLPTVEEVERSLAAGRLAQRRERRRERHAAR